MSNLKYHVLIAELPCLRSFISFDKFVMNSQYNLSYYDFVSESVINENFKWPKDLSGKYKRQSIPFLSSLSILQAKHCEIIRMNQDLCEGIQVDDQWCRAFLFNFKYQVWSSIGLVAISTVVFILLLNKIHILTYVKPPPNFTSLCKKNVRCFVM